MSRTSLWKRGASFIAWLRRRRRLNLEVLEDPPDQLKRDTIYIIGEAHAPWCAALLCPCGCGADIRLSMVKDDSPSWSARVNANGDVTLYPSIWRTKGCESHFFIFRSRVVWARARRATGDTALTFRG